GFFRNPEAFDILKRKVFPRLLQQRGDDLVRVWVLGCSTGQEAYSIAMVFAESSDNAPRPRKLQVFATDLNDALLDKARHGVYARNLTQEVTPERLRRFFVEEEGGYRISKSLREMVIFARQNLINDPPFSRIDLITCRNLMIYLEPSLQRKAIPAFHYALKPDGFLFLGASESVGGFTDLFEPFDKTHRIYSRKAAPPRLFQLPVKANPVERTAATAARKVSQSLSAPAGSQTTESFRGEISPEREADRVAVSRFAPCGVLVNADLQVLQFRGTTDAYLQQPTGKASFDVLKMAREGLMLPLRATINKAKNEDRIVRREGIRLPQGNKTRIADIEVIPLRNLKERCFLIVFEETGVRKLSGSVFSEPPETRGKTAGPGKEAARRIAELESELKETREYLQSVHERQEAANEELQASNEEVQSANEELQSVNEELETSKEELESANEELTTINEEMSSRNLELNRLNSDLVNIQTSARLPIVLLGRDLTIRRFSAQAEKQFNLLAADVGRPFNHVRHNLVWDEEQKSGADIDSFIADVIASVQEREREVRNIEGRWYSLRVRPYLTADNKVDGAVLVLVDISDLKRTEQTIAGARDFSEAIIRTVRDPLLILNADLRVHMANDAFYKTFHVHREESSGRRVFELGNHQWNIPKLRQLLEEILPRKSFFDDFEVTHEFESIGRRTMLLNARQLTIPGQPERILLGIQDATETLSFQAAAREDAEKFKVLFERSPLPKWTLDPNTLSFLNVNNAAVENYGYSLEEFLQMTLLDVLTDEARESLQAEHNRVPSRLPERAIYQHQKKSGEVIYVEVRVNEITIAGKLAWLASNNDITELQRAEQALKALNETLTTELASTLQLQETSTQLIVEDVPDGLFHQALNAAVTIMHSDMASIQMVDEERDALRLLASRGFEPDFNHTFKWVRRDTQTSCSVAWQERHRVIVPDVEAWAYLVDSQALEDHRKAGIRAVQSTPLISRNGRIIGVISTHWRNPYEPEESALRLIDILARQAADLIERNKAEEALRESDRRKSEFIAVLAHELRNPLSPIRSALEIIQNTASTVEDVHAATAMMERQVGQVVRLVDDLLDMSRISRGKVELRKEPIDVGLVINQAVEAIQTHVKSKELQLVVTLPPDPIYLNADPVRLGQIVVNLLNNACKFTDKGGNIWLTAEIESSRDNVLVKVRDSGIGIDLSQIHRIFDMFTQVEGPMQRTQGGLGIGLALTKNLVELHGGELH
ncbi:MAG TPA: CheR family methyltransferase, partial [Terriglobia bacterium]|nr:CheR family methyltransferase [Terriglobia bacterium]